MTAAASAVPQSVVSLPTLGWAFDAARRGWRVHPLNGKVPILKRWPDLATCDPTAVRRMWQAHPTANIGVVTGKVSGLVVLDFDGDGGRRTLEELRARESGLPKTVEVITGGGGLHLYFACPEKPMANRQRVLPGLDVRAECGTVAAPGSVHPLSALPYEYADGHDPTSVELAEMPSWLVTELTTAWCEVPLGPSRNARAQPPQLWASTAALLKAGADPKGRYKGDQSRAVMAIARGAVLSGWTYEELLDALLDPANSGGRKVQKRFSRDGDAAASAFVLRTFQTAARWKHDSDVYRLATKVRQEARAASWSGRAAATNRRVIEAMCQIAIQAGTAEFSASTYQLAELAGVRQKTAHAALVRLNSEDRWFRRTEKGTGTSASRYILAPPLGPVGLAEGEVLLAPEVVVQDEENVQEGITTPPTEHVTSNPLAHAPLMEHLSHDAFRNGALGANADMIWSTLRRLGSATTAELADALPLSKSTICRTLREKLRPNGLADRGAGRRWTPLERDLGEIAADLATDGAGAHQRQTHQRQRQRYRTWYERVNPTSCPPDSTLLDPSTPEIHRGFDISGINERSHDTTTTYREDQSN